MGLPRIQWWAQTVGAGVPTSLVAPGKGTSAAGWTTGYDVAGGWVVYNASNRIYRRDPAGTITAITPVLASGRSPPQILGLRPDGDVIILENASDSVSVPANGDRLETHNIGQMYEIPAGEVMGGSTLIGTSPIWGHGTLYPQIGESSVRYRNGKWIFIETRTFTQFGTVRVTNGSAWVPNRGPTYPTECF